MLSLKGSEEGIDLNFTLIVVSVTRLLTICVSDTEREACDTADFKQLECLNL